jgi:hypothetical protein
MNKKTLYFSAFLLWVTTAIAGNNVFTGTAASQAKACVSASNKAIAFVNTNAPGFQAHKTSPSTSECKCQGDNQTGWECQVTVSY